MAYPLLRGMETRSTAFAQAEGPYFSVGGKLKYFTG